VAQAIPTFCMSVFKLPRALYKEINGIMQKFWWGHKENQSKIHWMSWEKMGKVKKKGGLGFRDLVNFNTALVAKQIWRIMQNLESLVARIFKAKYFPHGSILEANVGKRPSYVWQSIILAKSIIEHGTIWRIGDGEDVRVWRESWILVPTSYSMQTPIKKILANAEFVN
jgi:hypothetical protein